MAIVRLRPADLVAALEGNAISLQFQVQVHVPTGSLAGVEALVRWPHPQYGMIGPSEIVQVVNEGSLHARFDEWVIREAERQAAAWVREGVPLPLIAVNVFEPTLRDPELLRVVDGAQHIELELPRRVARDAAYVAMIGSLRTRGVRIAVEELPEIDVDTLKLTPPIERSDVEAAKARGVRVVAQGIGDAAAQAGALAAGCEIVQGYVFGPEVSAGEVSALARR